ncbi:dihydrodipicolinate synthase family protein [Siphonobacter sp. BAB-5385]|uniref:dihydrodipicolinate synthase family protein n=1 Tax=unclassified Siphonobacter TaxID=2635712 RepID=UPI000B9E0CE3|nr:MULTISPECIES: dihydrodipicolinate synthase family protein [unclassified Siphonobacter]OZI09537.1 dihydrodipicolinate synthase family protein [Siphonobacter sp. BAB-5385]PMD93790.1 dihydrodipicolinate synthase family protein [Siphonobacter sp. BAB-5405]
MKTTTKGFIPVMLTPFKNDGSIDFPALTKLTNFYLEAGASGLFANCLSSEMFELNDEERLAVIAHVLEVTQGSVPVVATGTFGGPIPQQAEFVRRVHDLGTDAVILISGLLADEQDSDEVFNDRVAELLNLTDHIPLGFYECPVPYKRLISPEQLRSFVATGRIIYHKDTCLDLNQIREKLSVTDNPQFGLYDAYMVHAVDSLRAGSAGLSCIQGNFSPELIVWLCENYNSSEDEVQKVQQFLIDNMDVMHNVYPIVSKYFLQKRGFDISTFTRRNVGVLTPQIYKEVESLYSKYSQLKEELDLKAVY